MELEFEKIEKIMQLHDDLVNNDSYFSRNEDYSLYVYKENLESRLNRIDSKEKFDLVNYINDLNEREKVELKALVFFAKDNEASTEEDFQKYLDQMTYEKYDTDYLINTTLTYWLTEGIKKLPVDDNDNQVQ